MSALHKVPGSWNRRAYSTDRQGKRIPGTDTWRQRAIAWDKHLQDVSLQEEEALWRKRRQEVQEMEYQLGQKLMQRAERMQAAVLFERREENFVTVAGEQVAQTIILQPRRWSERDVAATARTGSELMRRAVDMPAGKAMPDWHQELKKVFPELDPDEFLQDHVDTLIDLINKRMAAKYRKEVHP